MEILSIIIGILGVVGGVITIISFFVKRDTATKDAERRITKIEVKQQLYKEEIDLIRANVLTVESKVFDKLDHLSDKIESLNEKIIDILKK